VYDEAEQFAEAVTMAYAPRGGRSAVGALAS
jgi:hypothetical protein